MSALGVVPGFAYPALDYGESEFLSVFGPTITLAAAAQQIVTLIRAGDGNAVYVTNVFAQLAATAAVANRQASLVVGNGDFVSVSVFPNSLSIAASQVFNWQWDTGISSVFSAVTTGVAPMQNVILPPGWSISLQLLNIQAGDKINGSTVTGRRIPTAATAPAVPAAVPTPLLT